MIINKKVLNERIKVVKKNKEKGGLFSFYELTLEDCDYLYNKGVISVNASYMCNYSKPYLRNCCANYLED